MQSETQQKGCSVQNKIEQDQQSRDNLNKQTSASIRQSLNDQSTSSLQEQVISEEKSKKLSSSVQQQLQSSNNVKDEGNQSLKKKENLNKSSKDHSLIQQTENDSIQSSHQQDVEANEFLKLKELLDLIKSKYNVQFDDVIKIALTNPSLLNISAGAQSNILTNSHSNIFSKDPNQEIVSQKGDEQNQNTQNPLNLVNFLTQAAAKSSQNTHISSITSNITANPKVNYQTQILKNTLQNNYQNFLQNNLSSNQKINCKRSQKILILLFILTQILYFTLKAHYFFFFIVILFFQFIFSFLTTIKFNFPHFLERQLNYTFYHYSQYFHFIL